MVGSLIESPDEAKDEWIEVCTPGGHPTGVKKSRTAIHADGDWHVASFVWVFDAAGRVLLQRRAPHKAVWPGRWDASAAGHVTAGETAVEAARRELAEELGLEVRAADLVRIDDHREEHEHPNGIVDREHHAVFILRADVPLEAYRPGAEVTAIAFATTDALLNFARATSALEIEMLETDRARVSVIRRLYPQRNEVVPYSAAYLAHLSEQINDLVRV